MGWFWRKSKASLKIGEIYSKNSVFVTTKKQQTPIGTNRNRVKPYKQGQNYEEDTKRRDYIEKKISTKKETEKSSGQIIGMLQLERE